MKLSKSITISLVITLIALVSFISGTQYQKSLTSNSSSQPTQDTPTSQLPLVGTVTRIIDGDTIELSTGQTVRYTGIAAPEKGQPYYQEATNLNEKLTLGKQIRLVYENGYEQDKFGRLLAYVFVGDKNLSVELVKAGLAKVSIYEKRRPLIYQDKLIQSEKNARGDKLGVWKTTW